MPRSSYWTASGDFFGYRTGYNLRTIEGHHVGRLVGNEVYGPSGDYLGEISQNRYLVVDHSKAQQRRATFNPTKAQEGIVPFAAIAPLTMADGFGDFPSADYFHRGLARVEQEQVESLLCGWLEDGES